MLADLIQKLAHETAANWADQSLQFSAAEQMGKDLARQHPEIAEELLKTAAKLNKEALGIVGKGLLGAGAVGLGAGAIYGGIKGAQYAKKRHQQIQRSPYRHGQTGTAHFYQRRQM